MSETNYRQLILVTTLAIIATGCASSGTTDTSTGDGPIQVNSFEAIPNPVPAGRTVNINMELENTGEATANQVAARIFGPTFGSGPNAWGNQRTVTKGARTETFGQLRAPSDNNPSIPKRKSWSLQSPELGPNRQVDYTFYSNIFYNYETRGNTDFKLVSGQRFREQGYSQTDATVEDTEGPIELDIRGTTPKIFYTEGDGNNVGQVESEICVRVINEGSGTAFLGGQTNDERIYNMNQADKNTVLLSVENVGNVRFNAVGEDTEGNKNIPVKLVGGNEGFQCFTMTASSLNNAEQNVNTRLTAVYNYMRETKTTVTVEGRQGSSGTTTDRPTGNTADTEDSDNTGSSGDGSGVQYEWTGTQSQLDDQYSSYQQASSVTELCRKIIEDDGLASENCVEK